MKKYTDNQGIPHATESSSLTTGEDGYTLFEDSLLHEKLASFNRERLAERVVHAQRKWCLWFF
ncbi:MAG: catalase [Clostridia bacterium]